MAELVLDETELIPHLNPGLLTLDDFKELRSVSASMGLMLESASPRLCERGGPHFGSPDKDPAHRIKTLGFAGEARVPFTSGILIGIGETHREQLESLITLKDLHRKYGHLQEIIIQNFRVKPDTKMADAPELDFDDLRWTITMARLIFGAEMSIQAPPNLSDDGDIAELAGSGINDWGGVSPVTPDFVNPEAPWPEIERLSAKTGEAGKTLVERLTVYPKYIHNRKTWLDERIAISILGLCDADGLARTDQWASAEDADPPAPDVISTTLSPNLDDILNRATGGEDLSECDVVALFEARGSAVDEICRAADALRAQENGDIISYVVNRNINYTNVCTYRCQFCAFSKGKMSENLRGRPYVLDLDEVVRRSEEAWARGGTEVCLQGGIHPAYTGDTYLEICRAIKSALPQMHIHAFSPLEVWQGAHTLGLSLTTYLEKLQGAGLGTLPGTAAEILDDEVREIICHDKITTDQWLEVIETAHEVGFRTTSTIMFGHIDRPINWARHLMRLRTLQKKTGGLTEFVPLPFVHMEAPLYLKGHARPGPTFREVLLIHAVARLALHPHITNIQTSWVKLGLLGVKACLQSGVNDLGGTLMNESITRAAGSTHGQEMPPHEMETIIRSTGRTPRQRTTLYDDAPPLQRDLSFHAAPVAPVVNRPAKEFEQA
jgi:FO synthase